MDKVDRLRAKANDGTATIPELVELCSLDESHGIAGRTDAELSWVTGVTADWKLASLVFADLVVYARSLGLPIAIKSSDETPPLEPLMQTLAPDTFLVVNHYDKMLPKADGVFFAAIGKGSDGLRNLLETHFYPKKQFQFEVIETLERTVVYTCEAESEEEARANASIGDTVDEDVTVESVVVDRRISLMFDQPEVPE